MLKIIGLGMSGIDMLSKKVFNNLKTADKIYVKTDLHPAAKGIRQLDIKYESFDHLYKTAEDLDEVTQKIVAEIMALDLSQQNIVYCVPGHPIIDDDTVSKISNQLKDYEVITNSLLVDQIFQQVSFKQNYKFLTANKLESAILEPEMTTIISPVYNNKLANKIKKILEQRYRHDYQFYILNLATKGENKLEVVSLAELDSCCHVGPLSLLYLPPDLKNNKSFNNLLSIMELLRSDKGCPWDREQTQESIRENIIEEAYEVVDRIDKQDYSGLAEELGDLLLQVVFQSQIAKENDRFNIYQVIEEICQKLIRRHPHVFADGEVDNSAEVLKSWEEIKEKEKSKLKKIPFILDQVPTKFPALLEAEKLQKKASKMGFDWPDTEGAVDKLKEEIIEFNQAYQKNDINMQAWELGDLLFSIVNISRFLDLDAELLLKRANQRFRDRFNYIEATVAKSGKDLTDLSLEELNQLWDEAKSDN